MKDCRNCLLFSFLYKALHSGLMEFAKAGLRSGRAGMWHFTLANTRENAKRDPVTFRGYLDTGYSNSKHTVL